ncbi:MULTISPECIES: hypothetical protein [Paenibacillus]|uniref:Uncharacterized protein n=2 Tax=Paenibacillus TaxID=44249 RepID=A0ABX2ZAI2_PAEPO|nr:MULTISPECIES: hypothetical protein [Paenibacillus]MDR6779407.1 hypothetical protein [Paenibacillus peoriae]ODA08303.1 hypothetical protein A7312_27590 [Paenibacillus polymyxa]
MSKFDLWEHGIDSWTGYFIIEALSTVGTNSPLYQRGYDPSSMEAKLIINGVELPLAKTFEHIGQQFEDMAKKRAEEILEEKIDIELMDSLRSVSRLTNDFEEELKLKINKMVNI